MEKLPGGLGRLPAADERDKMHLMASVPRKVDAANHKYWYSNGWWGDQGYTPQCVGYSWAHWVEDGPVTQKGIAPIVRPVDIYTEAQKIDEWEGEGYDGTSVRAGAKYLQAQGYISQYTWAWDADTVVESLLTKGPVVVGTLWYEDMFFPDSKGLIKVSGRIAGGHAYILDGVNYKNKIVRIKNSWGRNWGNRGYAYLSISDLDNLIKQDGEACLALEVKK